MRLQKLGIMAALGGFLILSGCSTGVDKKCPLAKDVKLAGIFGSEMVIQRDTAAPVWGWAQPGGRVTVTGSWGKSVETVTPKNGKWEVKLPTPAAGGPYTITVKGQNKIELKNVMSGDVWVCSGQSNMQMSVSRVKDSAKDIAAAKYNKIRLYKVPLVPSNTPLKDQKGKWVVCSPKTVSHFSATGYFFGRTLFKALDIPIGLINTSWGGTCIEAWTPWSAQKSIKCAVDRKSQMDAAAKKYNEKAAKDKYAKDKENWKKKTAEWKAKGKKGRAPRRPRFYKHPHKNQNYPVNLYNGMINPIVPLAIKGAIWYQGESNAGRAMFYRQQLEAMITAWRKVWGQGDFPFYFVQLPNYKRPATALIEASSWPKLREAFLNTSKEVPNTGAAITIEIGEARDIHPKNKQDVGDRLGRIALYKTYGKKDIVWTGPIYKSVKVDSNKAVIKFENGGAPLAVKGKGPIKWFALVGANGQIVAGDAKITGPDTVAVSSPKIKKVAAVYYAWAMNPVGVNLINKAGLPASPFRWGSIPKFEAEKYLPAEAKGYQVVYQLDPTNPVLRNGRKDIKYDIDNSAKVKGPFKKIAYFMVLVKKDGKVEHAFVSMDPFTQDVKKIGVPVKGSGARFQQMIKNCKVISNVAGVKNGEFPEGCNIEFWDCNYGGYNAKKIPGATNAFDFGDSMSTKTSPGYGCMQIHNYKAKQSVICFNKFGARSSADVGIGNAKGKNKDWTFSSSARNCTNGALLVLVKK